jgi:hypothetical protein
VALAKVLALLNLLVAIQVVLLVRLVVVLRESVMVYGIHMHWNTLNRYSTYSAYL